MSDKVTVIRMRWWGYLMLLFCIPIFAILTAAMGFAGLRLIGEAGGWWKGLLLLASAIFMLFLEVLLLNVLFTYRLEIGASGLRIIGNFWTHSLSWTEITRIERRINLKGIGYHVAIEVDGSRLPRRHWSGLWASGYQIPTPMAKVPTELAAYLKRKRREYLRRAQAKGTEE
ncbi:MAG: hypothetical protein O9293_06125 [Porphyrobacter sp.]|nr:hypothetical protein [Porphyrobacter sp.]